MNMTEKIKVISCFPGIPLDKYVLQFYEDKVGRKVDSRLVGNSDALLKTVETDPMDFILLNRTLYPVKEDVLGGFSWYDTGLSTAAQIREEEGPNQFTPILILDFQYNNSNPYGFSKHELGDILYERKLTSYLSDSDFPGSIGYLEATYNKMSEMRNEYLFAQHLRGLIEETSGVPNFANIGECNSEYIENIKNELKISHTKFSKRLEAVQQREKISTDIIF